MFTRHAEDKLELVRNMGAEGWLPLGVTSERPGQVVICWSIMPDILILQRMAMIETNGLTCQAA
jgi:hypothetical protein